MPRNRARGVAIVETALLVVLISIVAVASIQKTGKSVRCNAYSAACAGGMVNSSGNVSCTTSSHFGCTFSNSSPSLLLAQLKVYCMDYDDLAAPGCFP